MSTRKIWPTGWRAVVLLLVGSVMGANLISPAVAHITSLAHLYTHLDKRYQKIPTSAQRYTIAGSTFVDDDGLNRNDPNTGHGYCTTVGTGGDFYAPVHLPQGVTVTKFFAEYADDGTTTGYNGDVWLTRFPLLGKGGTYNDLFLAELNDTPTPGDQARVQGAIFAANTQKIDNTRYAYNVIGQMSANPAACDIEIQYTVKKPFAATGPMADRSGRENGSQLG